MADPPPLGVAISALLARRGIEIVFGIPGVHTVELYRGLEDSGLRHVTPRHEQGAGFMADGYARATGKIAACFVVTGPGLLNIAAAMGQALADSIPMLVLVTTNPRATLGRGEGRLHEIRGQSSISREIARFATLVLTKEQLLPALDEAFAMFAAERPGPALIELPIDLLSEPFEVSANMGAIPAPPAPDTAQLHVAAHLMNEARLPVTILGGGAVRSATAARDLVERIGGPVLSTANARGILPKGNALIAGGCLPFAPARDLLRKADLVLALGTELGETDFEYYGEGPIELSGKLIRVDIDPRQLGRNARADLAIHSDIGAFARALTPLLSAQPRNLADIAAQTRLAGLEAVEPRISRHRALIELIWRVLPEAIVVGDSTAASYGANLYAEPPAPRRWFGASTGFGTLGYALPAAIGAKIGVGPSPVVAIHGDGGLHYTLPELAAAVDAEAPVIVLLWNDRKYGEIETYMVAKQMQPLGTSLFATDFAAVARAFGANHIAAGSLKAVEAALLVSQHAERTTIIEMDANTFTG